MSLHFKVQIYRLQIARSQYSQDTRQAVADTMTISDEGRILASLDQSRNEDA